MTFQEMTVVESAFCTLILVRYENLFTHNPQHWMADFEASSGSNGRFSVHSYATEFSCSIASYFLRVFFF